MTAPAIPAQRTGSDADTDYIEYSTHDVMPRVKVGQTVELPEMPEDARKIRQHIARAWKAYRGDWVGHMPLVHERGDPDDNVLVNRCAPIVDKGVSFLFGEAPTFEVMLADGKKSAPKAVQAALDAALGDEDDFMTTLTMLAMNGGVAGQTFAKLLPADQDNDDDVDYPRIVVQDPQNYWVVTDPDDCNRVIQYVCEYDISSRPGYVRTKRVVTYHIDDDDKQPGDPDWRICTYTRERPVVTDQKVGIVSNPYVGEGLWRLVAEEDWPYEWSPIHACMNLPNPNEYWGVPDLTQDIIHLNSALNYVESNINKIGRLHGTPLPYATGIDAKDITVGPGRIACFPSTETTVGAVQWAGDLANLMAFAGEIRSDMDEQSRVPAVATGRQKDLPKVASGVALQMLFAPLIEKTTLKRRLYGCLIRSLCEHILEMLGQPGFKVKIHWPNVLPQDDLAQAQVAQIKSAVGFSETTVITDMGGDPDVEAENKANEAQKALDMYAKGQGMPPDGQPPTAAPGNPDSEPGSLAPPSSQQPQQNQPPVNNPAAVAQRNAVKAVARARKAG